MVTLPLMSFFYENACQSQLHFVKKKSEISLLFCEKTTRIYVDACEKTAHESIKMS